MVRIGWAYHEITPVRPAMLQGQMHVRIAREAADPLLAAALAVDGGRPGSCALMISCDLAMVSEELQNRVRECLHVRLPELSSDAVIMTATHTHDAQVIEDGFYPHPGGDVMTASEALAWTTDHCVEAAVEAWERRVPRQLGRAFGHAVVGHNRRAVYQDGRARMYGATDTPDFSHIEGYEDHSLDMLFVWELDGSLAGVVLTIPCPAQVDEHLSQFSADFWHEIRLDLRQRFGSDLFILPLCGAAGDQSPHFLVYGAQEAEMRRRRGLTERQEIALRVGDAVQRALDCTSPAQSEVTVEHTVQQLTLPPRWITRSEREWAAAAHVEALDRGDCPDLWWPVMLRDVIDRYDGAVPLPEASAELHVLRLGDAVIVTSPFELYLDYAIRIKARSPAAQTIVVQLAGGSGLFLPTERAVAGGHYGAHPAVAPVGPEAGAVLVEETLSAVEKVLLGVAQGGNSVD